MNKKILIYAITVILVICAGVLAVKNIVNEDDTIQTSKNDNLLKENEIINNTNVNENKVKNEIVNEINNEVQNIDNEEKIEEQTNTTIKVDADIKDDKEKAIEIAKKDWGEDDSVSFKFDDIDGNGNYIIVVREKSSMNALKWYTIDVDEEKVID